nr:MAG TPA: hypothetical protein [Caudoviricetes sp.]
MQSLLSVNLFGHLHLPENTIKERRYKMRYI